MAFAGFAHAMISSIKNNRAMLKKRKPYSVWKNAIENSASLGHVKDRTFSKKEMAAFRKELRVEARKKTTLKILVFVITILVIICIVIAIKQLQFPHPGYS